MKIILSIFCLCFAMMAKGQDVTLYNVNIVDVERGEVREGMTVVVKDGVIAKIGQAKKRWKKGQEDWSGRYLMPGLIESHSHWGGFGLTPGYMDNMTRSCLACGVTTARDAGGHADIAKAYVEEVKSGKRVGPTVYLSSFWVGAKYPLQGGEYVWERTIPYDATPEQLEQYILEAKEFGCTGLKLYHDLSAELLQQIVPLCHKHGIKPWGHFSTMTASALECVEAGVECLSHAYLIEGDEGFTPEGKARRFAPEARAYRDSVYRAMARRGAVLDATVYLCSLESAALPHNTVFTREAYEAGVTIAAGTDCLDFDNGFQCVLLNEMEMLADSCGMSLPDVLRAATTVGAKVLGMEGKIGVIREGAEADLLLLSSNPLQSLKALRKQEALYIDGKRVVSCE